ncbi:MAG: M15 family metallopeptidase [Candidatus Xenobiia bacterium LiM19]
MDEDNDYIQSVDNVRSGNSSNSSWGADSYYAAGASPNASGTDRLNDAGMEGVQTVAGTQHSAPVSVSDDTDTSQKQVDSVDFSRESRETESRASGNSRSDALKALADTYRARLFEPVVNSTQSSGEKESTETSAGDSSPEKQNSEASAGDDQKPSENQKADYAQSSMKPAEEQKDPPQSEKVMDHLKNHKTLEKKLDGLNDGEQGSALKAGCETYDKAIKEGHSEEKALKQAEQAVEKTAAQTKRDNENVKQMQRSLESSGDYKKQIEGLGDEERETAGKSAEDAYRKAKADGVEDYRAVRLGRDAGMEKAKEVRKDHDRSSEMEKLSPEDRSNVDTARARGEMAGKMNGDPSAAELKKTGDAAADRQLNNIGRRDELESSISRLPEEKQKELRSEIDRAYVQAASAGKDNLQCEKESVDRGRIVDRIGKTQSLGSDMQKLSPEARSSIFDSAHEAYRKAIDKEGDDKKALTRADEAARNESRPMLKEQSALQDLHKNMESSSFKKQLEGMNDKEKASFYKTADEAYRNAKDDGKSDWAAQKAAKEAADGRAKEISENTRRMEDIEKLSPVSQERVRDRMDRASCSEALKGGSEEEKERAAASAGDNEMKTLNKEKFVNDNKAKMNESQRAEIEGVEKAAYEKAISEGKSPEEARDASTEEAMKKVDPSQFLPPLEQPKGYSQIPEVFGEAGTDQTKVKMPAGPNGKEIDVTCHRKIADRMNAAFQEIKDRDLSHLIKSFDGCSNYREMTGSSQLSTHSWGVAFDVNAASNGYGQKNRTEDQRILAEVFQRYGFFNLPNDWMHFQYTGGY